MHPEAAVGRAVPPVQAAGDRISPKTVSPGIVEDVGDGIPPEKWGAVGVQAFWSMVGFADRTCSRMKGADCRMGAAQYYYD